MQGIELDHTDICGNGHMREGFITCESIELQNVWAWTVLD